MKESILLKILVLIAIILIPIQSSAEEYLLRGYMMQRIGLITGNRWFPLIFTSAIFGLLHSFNPEITEFGNSVYIFYVDYLLELLPLWMRDWNLQLDGMLLIIFLLPCWLHQIGQLCRPIRF